MSYFVYFGPNTGDPRFVYEWYGPEIASYTGGVAAGGDFDIADVPLLSPPRDAQVGLPVTFAWQVRPATSTDNYSVHLSGLINPDLETDLPSAGYTGSTTMVQLPSGFSANEDYVWEVWIDGPGGTGMSFDARFITFTAAANTARK